MDPCGEIHMNMTKFVDPHQSDLQGYWGLASAILLIEKAQLQHSNLSREKGCGLFNDK